ncbi:MAG: FtsW/RodA/SpoVE family cell cycle protein [Alistipes sp.]|nr:FtsW/RodA/SpoVE family cell cycle protein [Alistipes sp.]
MAKEDKSVVRKKEVPSILEKRQLLIGDKVLWVIVTLFFFISAVVVYSSIAKMGFGEGSTSEYLEKHILTLGGSIGLLIAFYFMGAKLLRFFTVPAYIAALLMTLGAYFSGGERNDAARWLDLGFFSFQPSELLKIGTIMLLAVQLSKVQSRINNIRLLPSTIDVRKWGTKRERDIIFDDIIPIIMPIAISCAVILPAHTSSAIHLFLISIAMLLIGGIRIREVGKLVMIAGVVGITIMMVVGRGDTVISRVKNWMGAEKVEKKVGLDKYSDSDRSKMAVYNGGFVGVGAGKSVMRARLTHPESDYLFAIVVEEFGIFVAFFIILLYLWLFFRALRIFQRSEWIYAGLLAVGLALLITSQGFIHIAVALGLFPETGQNLPFLTQGRTGMFCASIAMGMILSMSRQIEQGTLVPPSAATNPTKQL